jgi:hypothetical protein
MPAVQRESVDLSFPQEHWDTGDCDIISDINEHCTLCTCRDTMTLFFHDGPSYFWDRTFLTEREAREFIDGLPDDLSPTTAERIGFVRAG